MVVARRAGVEDAAELVRLRGVMLATLDRPASGPPRGASTGSSRWREVAEATLRARLARPDGRMAAYVVDTPGSSGGLAACAVGVIERRLPGPDNLSGQVGYVFNVVTDPGWRRRGYSRACMLALLAWYAERAVTRIDLGASPEGEPLYRALGFVPTSPAMRLSLPAGVDPAGGQASSER